ncbi:MAG: protein-glutamate methylesterase/protein-glutamine glutaminase [Psychrobium sp.]
MIKVLIVDDSKLVREIVSEVITGFADVEVVGAAKDAYEARAMIKQLDPDVLTLDVEMPKMDGITFLKNLMRLRPMPVVMLSTLTQAGADTTLDALACGAVDFISKPRSSELLDDLTAFSEELYQKIKLAAKVNVKQRSNEVVKPTLAASFNPLNVKHQIIALGASTGGTEALRDVLSTLPSNSPAVVVTQHIPASFSSRFALRLGEYCKMKVHEAKDGQLIEPGNIYVAPGSHHLVIEQVNHHYRCRLDDSAPCNRHKPSVDIMFESLSQLPTVNVYAALLTGMGSDGAQGLKALKDSGHYTAIQNKATSMIWGMPGAAFLIDAHCDDLPISEIAPTLLTKVAEQFEPFKTTRTAHEST